MNNMMLCKIQERVRDNGSNANNKISTSPPSHRRISTISSTHDFPYREPPLRIWIIQLGVHNSSLKQQSLHKRQGTKLTQSPLTRGTRHKANTPTTITSTLRGIPTQPPQSPLYLEGYQQTQIKEGLQLLVVSINHKPIFLRKIRS